MKRILKSLVLMLGMLMVPIIANAEEIYGDVNGDLEVNIADVNAIIDVILNDATILTADVNQDGEINIADINVIIDIILNGDDNDQFSVLCERASEVDYEVIQYYEQCESLDEMMQHADAIRALDDVEDVYSNGTTTMFVKIKDFFTLMYSFYPGEYEEANNQAQQRIKQIQDVISQNSNRSYGRNGLEGVKFLAVNQQTDWDWSVQSAATACSIFEGLGFESDVNPSPNVEFFTDGIFDCDYLFIITHGCYDMNADIHWLSTSVPVERYFWGKIKKSFLKKFKNYGADEIAFEVENIYTGEAGPIENKSRVKVSEHLIKNKSTRQFRHPGKAVVFNVACQSMKGPTRTDSIHTGLAQAFINRGACVYLGYDEAIVSGQVAGLEFWHRLAMGLTISDAINHLTPWLYHEYHDYYEGEWANYWADLTMHPKDANFPIYVTQPVITYEDKSNDTILQIDLKATGLYTSHIQATNLNTWELLNDYSTLSQWGIDYGFELCEDDQFNEGVSVVDEKHCGEQGLGYPYLDYSCPLTYSPSDPNSKIRPGTTYWARAYMSFGDGYNYSEPITFTTGSISGGTQEHEYVDLGLPSGTLWATCNIGASTPEEYGDYFAWGEITPKNIYDWSTYKWCKGSENSITKYCTNSEYGYNGFRDGKKKLDLEDDAAYMYWGSHWRIPTEDQLDELIDECTWTWTTQNGVNGRMVTGPNGNSIFLPAAGGYFAESYNEVGSWTIYWSSTLHYSKSNKVIVLGTNSENVYESVTSTRCLGFPVRAVRVP